jgi:hypothetical protein
LVGGAEASQKGFGDLMPAKFMDKSGITGLLLLVVGFCRLIFLGLKKPKTINHQPKTGGWHGP